MKEIYQQSLDNIFGKKRVVVSIIHNNTDLNIFSNERELLKSIKKNQMDNYNIDWFFKETIFGKSIYIDLNNLNNLNTDISSDNINFSNIDKDYKDFFVHRINIIMDRTHNVEDNKFNNYVDEFNKLISKKEVNFEKYKSIRNNFETYN
tara:strand:+ start:766 stop:1212 length:447 start_codon:yes stop_codon:yes gene_type:complete